MRLFLFCCAMLAILTVSFSSGYSVPDWFLSSAEKIHRAFPPSVEVRIALEDARENFREDPELLKDLEDRVRSQTQLRSLICTQNMPIGRLDSVEKIKTLPVKPECLAKQDQILAEIISVIQMGHLLAQPPLYPLTSLDDAPPISKVGGHKTSMFESASQANVVLVRGDRIGNFASAVIPSGKTLATMPKINDALSPHTPVSPNGRLAAVNTTNSGVIFLDMEQGKKLWETSKFTKFYAWLPDASAILVHEAESNSPMLLDLITGSLETYSAAPKNLKWVTTSTEIGTVWMGSSNEVFRVEHVRNHEGIEATVTKTFRLSKTQGITGHPPTLMNHNKILFFVSNRDFGSLNLETGQETAWNVSDFIANRYAKLSENTLLVDSYASDGRLGMHTWILDITNRTLASVDESSTAAARHGLLMELRGRTGWIRRGHKTNYLGSTVPAGTPQSLDELYSAFKLERQKAMLESIERHEESVIEPSAPKPKPSIPPQTIFPQNAYVEAIGVYQGAKPPNEIFSDGRKMGIVDVRVRSGSTPVILVLSSYEPVQWKVTMDPGAKVAGVLMSGYYQSQVTGIGSVRVLQMGRTHTYNSGTSEYYALDRQVQSLTGGKGIKVFQGRYEGGSYSVGG